MLRHAPSALSDADAHVHQKCRQGTLITDQWDLESRCTGVRYLDNVIASFPSGSTVTSICMVFSRLPSRYTSPLHPPPPPVVTEIGTGFYLKSTFIYPCSVFHSSTIMLLVFFICSRAVCGILSEVLGKVQAQAMQETLQREVALIKIQTAHAEKGVIMSIHWAHFMFGCWALRDTASNHPKIDLSLQHSTAQL